MPVTKSIPAKKAATPKETASVKSEGAAALAKKSIETSIAKRLTEIEGRLQSIETTVDAIRREYKSKGIPMP